MTEKLDEWAHLSATSQDPYKLASALSSAVSMLRRRAPLPAGPGREEVARIIDSEAFATLREIAAARGLDAANPPVGVVLMDPIDEPLANRADRREAALAKADAILDLFAKPSPEDDTGQATPSGVDQTEVERG